jgi:hypothetical protein
MIMRSPFLGLRKKVHGFQNPAKIQLITPSGMIKADRKGKASGLENLRPYHRMESMRKSNILS